MVSTQQCPCAQFEKWFSEFDARMLTLSPSNTFGLITQLTKALVAESWEHISVASFQNLVERLSRRVEADIAEY